jgi:hypothetical protein
MSAQLPVILNPRYHFCGLGCAVREAKLIDVITQLLPFIGYPHALNGLRAVDEVTSPETQKLKGEMSMSKVRIQSGTPIPSISYSLSFKAPVAWFGVRNPCVLRRNTVSANSAELPVGLTLTITPQSTFAVGKRSIVHSRGFLQRQALPKGSESLSFPTISASAT